jgi:3-oxoadipate enol-lactonase
MSSTTLPHDDLGHGAPLVLLHAFPVDARIWDPQRAALSAKRRVITPDFAGFGRARDLATRTSIDAHADDIQTLLDALGIPKATLIGLSMGGYVALAFARRYPAQLSRLVLADTRAGADSPEVKAGRERMIAQVEAEGMAALFDGLLPRLLTGAATAEVKERVRRIALDQAPDGMIAAQRAMRDRPDQTHVLGTIDIPTLVIVGEHDAITPPADTTRMVEALRCASLEIVKGAGHLSNQEAPEAFNAALLAWLDGTGR